MEHRPGRQWFYESEGERQGPVGETRLGDLRRDGIITDSTLIWSDGMEGWTPCEAVFEEGDPGDPLVTCAVSGERRPQSRMLPFGDRWVAPEHKETFVQQLREGEDRVVEPIEGVPFPTNLRLDAVLVQSWRILENQWKEILGMAAIVWTPEMVLAIHLDANPPEAEAEAAERESSNGGELTADDSGSTEPTSPQAR